MNFQGFIFRFLLIFSFTQYEKQSVFTQTYLADKPVVINDTAWYIHTINQGETLYSISRTYKVKLGDIAQFNYTLGKGIQPGQKIRIPAREVNVINEYVNTDDFFWHFTRKKETLYSISRTYGVDIDGIKNLNPSVNFDKLKTKVYLKIPVVFSNYSTNPLVDSLKYFTYNVLAQETLYSLSRRYGLSIKEILSLNPEIEKFGLKAGQTIVLPINQADTTRNTPHSKLEVSQIKVFDYNPVFCDTPYNPQPVKKLNVAVFLPLFSNHSLEIDQESNNKTEHTANDQTNKFNLTTASFIEFYNGVLLSLNQFKRKGMEIHLNVYDAESGTDFEQQVKTIDFETFDLIIGPAFNDKLKILSKYVGLNKLIISPVTNKEEILESNPNVCMINPPQRIEDLAFVKILLQHKDKNIIVVHPNDIDFYTRVQGFKSNIVKMGGDSLNAFIDYPISNFDLSILGSMFSTKKENVLAIPVDDEAFVNNVILNMRNFMIEYPDSTYKFRIIGRSEWLNYKTIDFETLFTYGFQYFTPFYFDYNSIQVMNYLDSYKRLFDYEPLRMSHNLGYNYSLLGFDITNYFISYFNQYGLGNIDCLPAYKSNGTMIDFQFVKMGTDNGYSNSNYFNIKFLENYDVKVEVLK